VTGTAPLPWRTAWIVGGSTGIGKDLALRLAQAGVKTAITARSAGPLAEAASLHANLFAHAADATSPEAMQAAHASIVASIGAPDLVVLNAAIWDPMSADDYSAARAIKSMQVNYGGVCTALEIVLPAMKQRRSGHIAIVASVAGYRGFTKALAYAPTKAALINLAESMWFDLTDLGIGVSVICPGYVDTPATQQNSYRMPALISAAEAAEHIVAGWRRGRFHLHFPKRFTAWLRLLRHLGDRAYFKLVRRATGL